MSAIYEEPDGSNEPVKVLITLNDGMDTMDAVGPLEVFSWAQHDKKNPGIACLFRSHHTIAIAECRSQIRRRSKLSSPRPKKIPLPPKEPLSVPT